MATRRLIEKHRRKADLDVENCTPIVLADGAAWYFPKPWLEVRPIFRQGKAVNSTRMLTAGEVDPLFEDIGAEKDPLKQALKVLTLGALLLMRNYDVEDTELGRLFILRPGEKDSERMLREIISVATGKLSDFVGPEAITDPKE